MRAFIVISSFFVALNLLAAGGVLAAGKLLLALWPAGAENVLACMAVALGGVGLAVWAGFAVVRFIGRRPPRSPARGPG